MFLVLLALVAIGIVLFAYQNPESIHLTFGLWTWHVPLWYPLAASAFAVLLCSTVWMLGARRRWRSDEKALGAARHEAVIANHAALLSDHESELATLHREIERLADELNRRRELLA